MSTTDSMSQSSATVASILSVSTCHYDNVIVDVGDVILNWDSKHHISDREEVFDLHEILRHPLWQDVEKGKLTASSAYTQLGSEFSLSTQELIDLFALARKSIRINTEIIALLTTMKDEGKRIICLSNMDRSSFLYIFANYRFWSLFHTVYVSSLLSMRKPNEEIFQFILKHLSLKASQTIFIDNNEKNLSTACKLGLQSIGFEGQQGFTSNVKRLPVSHMQQIQAHQTSVMTAQVERAYLYLFQSLRRNFICPTFIGEDLYLDNAKPFSAELFSTLLVLKVCPFLPDDVANTLFQSVMSHRASETDDLRWCFYQEAVRPEGFPDDLDTTAMALSCLLQAGRLHSCQLNGVIHDILASRNSSGILQVYFDPERSRIDAVVCLNVLYLFAQLGMADRPELEQTKAYVLEHLRSGAYCSGTRYYPSPETFLYSLWRLVHHYEEHFGYLECDLKKALISRVNLTSYPIERAIRVTTLGKMGVVNRIDYIHLLDAQLSDGGWPMGALFIAFRSQIYFGSRELTTAFALEAMSVMGEECSAMEEQARAS